jgi:hypothetical protein
VRSTNPLTGEAITLTITPNGIRDVSPPAVVISMLEPDRPFQADVVQRFCHCVPFFASPESGRQWTRDHPDTFLLTIEETNAVALDSWPFRSSHPHRTVGWERAKRSSPSGLSIALRSAAEPATDFGMSAPSRGLDDRKI